MNILQLKLDWNYYTRAAELALDVNLRDVHLVKHQIVQMEYRVGFGKVMVMPMPDMTHKVLLKHVICNVAM